MMDQEHEKEDVMEAEEICSELQKLIEREKEESEDESKDVALLQKAYDLCEKFIKSEESEEGSSESLATMPIEKARKKVQKNAFKLPAVPKNEPISSSENENPNTGY